MDEQKERLWPGSHRNPAWEPPRIRSKSQQCAGQWGCELFPQHCELGPPVPTPGTSHPETCQWASSKAFSPSLLSTSLSCIRWRVSSGYSREQLRNLWRFRVVISAISHIILCYLQQPLWAQGSWAWRNPGFHEHCFFRDIFTLFILNAFGKAGSWDIWGRDQIVSVWWGFFWLVFASVCFEEGRNWMSFCVSVGWK